MSQQKQAPLPRQEFQEWLENAAVPVLVLQKGKHLGSVVKVPATPEIDYLFGCETFYGERISWSDRLEFCGLYDRQHQALHLLDDPLPNFVSGLTEEECQDSTAFGKRIAQEVDRYVEAAISNERSRLSVRELTSERNINSYRYYKGTEAGREAASLVFSGEKPDVQFHSEYYTSLTEDTLLSYLKSPEDYIKTTAEQYMRDNQEEFLAQFLKKDALLAEYQMLSQDSDAPVYRMRAITDALQKSGAKTVNVTVQKDGVELTFKTSAESLKGLKSQYSTWYIAPSDRLQFRHLFGAGSDYSAEDIIRIAYGRSTLYEAPSAPAEDIEMQVYRSSGAGGQHINKTSSAVRLIHKPTGVVVSCQTQRSQFQNRDYAMEMLKAKLYQIAKQQHMDKIDDIKGVQNEIAWGHQIRSYVFMPYTLVKDNRTGFESSNVQAVMDGDLDGFIFAYLKAASRGELKED